MKRTIEVTDRGTERVLSLSAEGDSLVGLTMEFAQLASIKERLQLLLGGGTGLALPRTDTNLLLDVVLARLVAVSEMLNAIPTDQ